MCRRHLSRERFRPNWTKSDDPHHCVYPLNKNNTKSAHVTEASDPSAALARMTGCPAPPNALGSLINRFFERVAS